MNGRSNDSRTLKLMEGERVLDVTFQPCLMHTHSTEEDSGAVGADQKGVKEKLSSRLNSLPPSLPLFMPSLSSTHDNENSHASTITGGSNANGNKSSKNGRNDGPLGIGILTTHRVLVLVLRDPGSSPMIVSNSHTHTRDTCRHTSTGTQSSMSGSGVNIGDTVTSIAWSGPSLLLSSRSGAISFLLPFASTLSLCPSLPPFSSSSPRSIATANTTSLSLSATTQSSVPLSSSHPASQISTMNCASSSQIGSKYSFNNTLVRSLGFRDETDVSQYAHYSDDKNRNGNRESAQYMTVNGNDNRSLTMGLLCSLPRHLTTTGMISSLCSQFFSFLF